MTPCVDIYKRFHLNKHYFNTVRTGLSVFSHISISSTSRRISLIHKDSLGLVPNELEQSHSFFTVYFLFSTRVRLPR